MRAREGKTVPVSTPKVPRSGVTLEWTDKQFENSPELGPGPGPEPEPEMVAELAEYSPLSVGPRPRENLLIQSDNRVALTRLRASHAGSIRCVYLDPPFNTGGKFQQYDDAQGHARWLSELRGVAVACKALLAQAGSLWLHLDDREVHYAKVLLDEVMGRENFVASVVWQKVFAKKNKALISGSHDTLLVYARAIGQWQRNLMPRSEKQTRAYTNRDDDPRGPWQSVSYSVQSEASDRRAMYRYPIEKPAGGQALPPAGRHWNGGPERTAQLVAQGRLWFGPVGDKSPRLKVFASEVQAGIVPDSWWPHTECGHNQEAKKELLALFPGCEPFATPKPERLLHRILQIASDRGDWVLDPYAGSGTTPAVAHKLGRRWIACERGSHCHEMIQPRLAKVVAGLDPGGVTPLCDWHGGGSFSYLRPI